MLIERDRSWSRFTDGEEYRKASANWKDGASLQAFLLGGTGETFDEAMGLQLYAEPNGLRVRLPAGDRRSFTDASATVAHIPGTPVSQVSFGRAADKVGSTQKGSRNNSDPLGALLRDYEHKTLGIAPPEWLVRHAKKASFAWYTPREGKLWGDWLASVEIHPPLSKALRTAGVRLGRDGAIREVEGRFYAKSGKILLAASQRARLIEALGMDTKKPGLATFLSGRLDGAACAAAIRGITRSVSTELKNTLNVFAIYASALEIAEFRTVSRANEPPLFEGVIRPRLSEEGVDLEAVDQWLASPKIRNSAQLPRSFAAEDLQRPLKIRARLSEDATGFAGSFSGIARLQAKVLGPTEVELTVQPGVSLGAKVSPAPLTASAKEALLGTSGLVNPSHPRIRKLAKRLALPGKSPEPSAKAVLAWVKENISYEITPQGIDAVDVLDGKRGDCTEYSVLAVSLLRASGVPAELRQGMAVQGAEMVAHNWIAYHDGTGWREADPTAGTTTVGSGHIEASLLEFISLMSVGGLNIVSAEIVK